MKKLLFFLFLLFFNTANSQTPNSPYPVIFVHGLNSDDQTWNTIINQLSSSWNLNNSHTLNFVLNARGGDTTNYQLDVLFPSKDVSGNTANSISNSSIYTINFKNFWNRNNSDPRIVLNSISTPGTDQSTSNQSAIYKQGYALKIMIDSVLRVTGASKVILLGHSMGGLAIREYLQRFENGFHKWWINPADSINGHKIAKAVTIGTPHLGTNVNSIPFFTIDNKSEAMRDMKFSYSGNIDAAFLFGNLETTVPTSYYNADINCNGIVTDTITGLDSNSADNSLQPLPKNILYTWITSNYLNLGTDGAVPLGRQLLYDGLDVVPLGLADTLLTNKNHVQETGDNKSLIRGLDEPGRQNFAYDISLNKLYSGFITLQTNGVTSDSDYYHVQTSTGGKITVNLTSQNAGVNNISLLSANGNVLATKNVSGSSDSISNYVVRGDYYIRAGGNSNQNPNLNSYNFVVKIIPASVLDLKISIEGLWNGLAHVKDTLNLFLANQNSPYNNIDSTNTLIDSMGNLTAHFIHTQSGNFYLKVKHRNSLETWSAVPINFISNMNSQFDFTSSQSMAFGNNQILKSGKWNIFSGDVNFDGIVDVTDLSIIDNDVYNLTTGYVNSDLTGDLTVDLDDASIADNNGFNFVSVIRP